MSDYDPPGILFYDQTSDHQYQYVTDGHAKGWLVYLHHDGQGDMAQGDGGGQTEAGNTPARGTP